MNSDSERGDDGGGVEPSDNVSSLQGTPIQVEWAVRIRHAVNEEFDRVAASFRVVAAKQTDVGRARTEAVLAILEDKRIEVMSDQRAGYFIKNWQEISDQVRQLIFHDPRYQALKLARDAEL